jgi:hypothetical protein
MLLITTLTTIRRTVRTLSPTFFELNDDPDLSLDEIKSLKIFATSKDKVISGPTSTGTATATGPKSASTGGSGSVTRIGTFSSVQGWAGAVIGAVTGLFALLG